MKNNARPELILILELQAIGGRSEPGNVGARSASYSTPPWSVSRSERDDWLPAPCAACVGDDERSACGCG